MLQENRCYRLNHFGHVIHDLTCFQTRISPENLNEKAFPYLLI